MYGVTEIRKQNASANAVIPHEREARFIPHANGNIQLINGARVRFLEKGRDDEAIAKFLDDVRGQSAGRVKSIVKAQFN